LDPLPVKLRVEMAEAGGSVTRQVASAPVERFLWRVLLGLLRAVPGRQDGDGGWMVIGSDGRNHWRVRRRRRGGVGRREGDRDERTAGGCGGCVRREWQGCDDHRRGRGDHRARLIEQWTCDTCDRCVSQLDGILGARGERRPEEDNDALLVLRITCSDASARRSMSRRGEEKFLGSNPWPRFYRGPRVDRGGTARRLALGSDTRCRSMASARPPWVTSWAQATAAEDGLHPVWNQGGRHPSQ
jgi:hypothetical protein